MEVGAGDGRSTDRLIQFCRRSRATLHTVDPHPAFDAAAWQEQHRDCWVFHRTTSLGALPHIDAIDALLIDGDHNWYTVFHELKLVERRCDERSHPFPLVMLHDAGWPYGRRDLYYDPETIPEAFRHPHARKGMRPGVASLVESGGLNPHLLNALVEGGARNGVLTAIEDFLGEAVQPLELVTLPAFNGLAVLVASDLRATHADLWQWLAALKPDPSALPYMEAVEAQRVDLEILRGEQRRRSASAKRALRRRKERAAEVAARAEQLQAMQGEMATLREKVGAAEAALADHARELRAVRDERDRQRRRLERLGQLAADLESATHALLRTKRWKMADALGELADKVLMRGPRPRPSSHVLELIDRLRGSTGSVPADRRASLELEISRAEAASAAKRWPDAVVAWQGVLDRAGEGAPGGGLGADHQSPPGQRRIDRITQKAQLNLSVARRICAIDAYRQEISAYRRLRAERPLDQEGACVQKLAIYTAICGHYDSIKLPAQLDPRFDYILFSDGPAPDTGVYQVRPVTYFAQDRTRAARFVKTHPHVLLPEYDIAIWIDSNIMILGDVYALVEEFIRSGQAIAAVPHPLRASIRDELDACIKAGKDDPAAMQEQVVRYEREDFADRTLIESNLLFFDLKRPELHRLLNAWWAEIDRYSRRDQLSLPYLLHRTGMTWHRIATPPHSVRDHPAFALEPHDRGTGPAHGLVEALQPRLVDPYSGPAYAAIRDRRIEAQRRRRIDIVVRAHGALAAVMACLESIGRARTSPYQRLIVIDDGSDDQTARDLADLAGGAPWIELHRNEQVGGDARAVNQGLAISTGELVIVLAGDTIVTDGWAEKLADAVFSTPGAGLVGPLGNAPGHQSLSEHDSGQAGPLVNALPPGVSAEDMSRLCEQWTVASLIPRVPLLDGFCLGLTRSVVERVGLLDVADAPQRHADYTGYCFRAADAGFSLVVATHTYVLQARGASGWADRPAAAAGVAGAAAERIDWRPRARRAGASLQANRILQTVRESARSFYAARGAARPAVGLDRMAPLSGDRAS